MSRAALIALAAVATLASPPARAADAALDCEQATTTPELNACAGQELDKADADLNAIYKTALAGIPGMAQPDTRFNAKAWEDALRASQRAWVAYRDAECDVHAPMHVGGGTATTVEVLGCKTQLTRERTNWLQAHYQPK